MKLNIKEILSRLSITWGTSFWQAKWGWGAKHSPYSLNVWETINLLINFAQNVCSLIRCFNNSAVCQNAPANLRKLADFIFRHQEPQVLKSGSSRWERTALYNIIMILWRVCLLTLLKSALRICSPQAYRSPNTLWLRAAVPRTALPTCLSRSRQFILHCMTSSTWYWQEKTRWGAKPRPGMGTSEEASTFFKKDRTQIRNLLMPERWIRKYFVEAETLHRHHCDQKSKSNSLQALPTKPSQWEYQSRIINTLCTGQASKHGCSSISVRELTWKAQQGKEKSGAARKRGAYIFFCAAARRQPQQVSQRT